MIKEKYEKQEQEKEVIVSTNYGGMCNRLKGWISVLRMAINSDPQKIPKLYWPKNDLCGCNFKDLFKNEPLELSGIQGYIKNPKYKFIDTWRFLLSSEDKLSKDFAKVYPTKDGEGKDIDFEYDRIPEKIRESLLLYVNALIPQKDISKKVEGFVKRYDIENRVGIHVRRGDFNNLNDGRGKISTNEDFFKRIDELITGCPTIMFFLTTDDKKIELEYIERYKDRMIVCPRVNVERERDSVLAAQEALIDLLILSKTKHIIGTYLSSFTEMAWWFGNCKAKVEIMGDYKIKEKEKIVKQLYGSGFVCVTKFWNGLVRKVKQL